MVTRYGVGAWRMQWRANLLFWADCKQTLMLLNRLQLNHFDRKEELIIKSVHVNFLNVWPCMLIVTLFHSIIKVQKPSDAKESLTLLASVRWGEPICTTENIRISAQVVFFPSYSVCSMMSDIVTGRTSPSGSHYL